MNRNRTTTSRTSPGWAPPLWLLIAGTILVAAAGLLAIACTARRPTIRCGRTPSARGGGRVRRSAGRRSRSPATARRAR